MADLDRRPLLTVGIASTVINLLLFALPLYTLWLLTLIVVIALALSALVDILRSRMLLRIGNAYALALGPRLLDASIAYSARMAEPNGQAMRDLQTVRSFVSGQQGLVTLFDAPQAPLFLAMVYAMHPGLGHTMLFGMVVLLGVALATESLTGQLLRTAGEAGFSAQRRIDAVMQNAEVVEAMGMRAAMRNYWQLAQSEAMGLASQAGDCAAWLAGLAKAVRLLLSLLLAAVGAWFAIHDQITIAAMVAVAILAARGLAPLETMIGAWKGLVSTRGAISRLNLALDRRFHWLVSGLGLVRRAQCSRHCHRRGHSGGAGEDHPAS